MNQQRSFTCYLLDIHKDATPQEVEQSFSHCGTFVGGAKMKLNQAIGKQSCFLNFTTLESAMRAIKEAPSIKIRGLALKSAPYQDSTPQGTVQKSGGNQMKIKDFLPHTEGLSKTIQYTTKITTIKEVHTKDSHGKSVDGGNKMGRSLLETQVIFSFDTTGSMYPYLEEVKSSVANLISELLAEAPDVRIGLICHGDYCDKETSYILKSLDFTKKVSELKNFIDDCGITHGGDSDECYEFALRKAKKMFAKNKKQAKAQLLVMIGDCLPHEPNYHLNIQKIDWREEINELAKNKVTVCGVQCGYYSGSSHFYKHISEKTGGSYINMNDLSTAKELLVATCIKASSDQQYKKYKKKRLEKKHSEEVFKMLHIVEKTVIYRVGKV